MRAYPALTFFFQHLLYDLFKGGENTPEKDNATTTRQQEVYTKEKKKWIKNKRKPWAQPSFTPLFSISQSAHTLLSATPRHTHYTRSPPLNRSPHKKRSRSTTAENKFYFQNPIKLSLFYRMNHLWRTANILYINPRRIYVIGSRIYIILNFWPMARQTSRFIIYGEFSINAVCQI